jgi:hypothetical protein
MEDTEEEELVCMCKLFQTIGSKIEQYFYLKSKVKKVGHTHIHTYIYIYIYTHIHIHTHTYILTHTYTLTYTHSLTYTLYKHPHGRRKTRNSRTLYPRTSDGSNR